MLLNEIPLIFRRGNIYATAAVAGASVYLLLQHFGIDETAATYVGMFIVAALRFAGAYWGLQVPVFHFPDPPSGDAGDPGR